jgi:hemoglobin-like flavoprotein
MMQQQANGKQRRVAMTPIQVGLVQESWKQVLPIKDEAAQMFYRRLFELNPGLQSLFKGEMAEQRRKLMAMIGTAVSSLGRVDTLVPALRELGRKHGGYGVHAKDYDTVGAALLWTLEQGLGAQFTPEVRAAWTETYGVLAATMQAGATAH